MARKIQDNDIKSEAELIAAGGGASDLPQDTKIYLSGKAKKLSTALSDGSIEYISPEYDNGNSGAAKTINFANGLAQKMTMTAVCTVTLTNPVPGEVYQLKLIQDSTGAWAVSWPGTVKWSGGVPFAPSVANKIDIVTLYWDGTNYFGSYSLNY